MGKSCCYSPGTMCMCKHSPKPSFDGHRPPAHSHRPPNNFPNASKNRATPNGARCTSLLAQTSSHGPKTIKCLSMVLSCRQPSLRSRGVEAFRHQGGPKWPWLHELEGMRRHLSKVDPNGPTVVPSCKGDAIQLIQHHMPHTHAPPQNTHFTKTCPKPSRGHGRPPKHSWCHPSYILYICKKGPIRILKTAGS